MTDSAALSEAATRLTAAGLVPVLGAPLAACGTLRLGGPAALRVDCRRAAELETATQALRGLPLRRVVIGGGSNLLFSDHGYPGVVLRFRDDAAAVEEEPGRLVVSGAAPLDTLAAVSVAAGRAGLVHLSGIPGTVGGAVAGNAGAWGEQIGDAVERVRLLEPDGRVREAGPEDLGFAYRRSALQHGGAIVLSAWLRAPPGDPAALAARRAEILALRAEKHPRLDQTPSIGSIFRNVEPTSAAGRRQAAGWFLEQAGVKDFVEGGARLFPRHANIIIRADPECRAQHVRDLAARMRSAVETRFGFRLEREVRFLGRFQGEAEQEGFF
jgi:UDP-N-acetylmuramate dehydrogenase